MSGELSQARDLMPSLAPAASGSSDRGNFATLIDVLHAFVEVGDVDFVLRRVARQIHDRYGLTGVVIGVIEGDQVRLAGLYPDESSGVSHIPLAESIFRHLPSLADKYPVGERSRELEFLGLNEADATALHLAPIPMYGDLVAGIAAFGPAEIVKQGSFQAQITVLSIIIGARFRAAAQVASERQHLDRLIRLQNLTARIIRHDNLVDVGPDILEDIADVFDYAGVHLGLQFGDEIHFFDTYRDAARRQNQTARFDAESGLASKVIRTGLPQFVDRPAPDDGLPAEPFEIRQVICVPLRVNGDVAGVLCATMDDRRILVVDDLGILIMLAESIGLVLANYRRLYEVERRNHQLRLVDSLLTMIAARTMIQRAIPEIVREIANRFAFQLVGIGLIKGERINFTLASVNVPMPPVPALSRGIPIDRGVPGRVIRNGEAEFIPDVRKDPDYIDAGWGARSAICVPIWSSGSIIGVLNVESGAERPLDEADLEILQIIASHLGIAFENEALLISERSMRRAVEALQQVSTIVTSTLEVDEALRRIVDTLGSFFEYRYVVAGLTEGEFVVPKAAHGIALERLVPVPLGYSPTGRVAQNGERVFIADLRAEQRIRLPQFPDATSMLVVPIVREREILGVLDVLGTVDRPIGYRDVELLETFARHAGIVLENARMYEDARQMALIDSMTQLPNRRKFQSAFEAELERAREDGTSFAVIMIDLDGFKEINDVFGHLEGDAVLTAVGQRLASRVREEDVMARYAGDEFVALLPDADTSTSMMIAERLREAIADEPFRITTGETTYLTISVGVAVYPDHGTTTRDLLNAADNAAYDAKHAGRNAIRMARAYRP
ncbi:MAG TPA: sensor domain-containing diguanylate cyclase [Thermomicrobiales bacterium]|nr:sensor domain-containing diguanylate cyclase [Thermomicrobiales bacterium]